MGRLEMRICEAQNLPNIQNSLSVEGTIGLYCIVSVENQTHKTECIKNNIGNPKWDAVFTFQVDDETSAQLRVQVWNVNPVSDNLLGESTLSLADLCRGQIKDEWYVLTNNSSQGNGQIRLRVCAMDFGSPGQGEEKRNTPSLLTPEEHIATATTVASNNDVTFGVPLQGGVLLGSPVVLGQQPVPQPLGGTNPPPTSTTCHSNSGVAPSIVAPSPQQQFLQPQWGGGGNPNSNSGGNPRRTNITNQSHPGVIQQCQQSVNKLVGDTVEVVTTVAKTTAHVIDKSEHAHPPAFVPLYMNDADGKVFLNLGEGILRLIPNSEVFFNLFDRQMNPNEMWHFPNVEAGPPPGLSFGYSLPPFARLVSFNREMYFIDIDDSGQTVRRHLNDGALTKYRFSTRANPISALDFETVARGRPIY